MESLSKSNGIITREIRGGNRAIIFGSAVAERGSIRSIRSFAPGKGSLVERKRYRTGARGEIDIGVEFEAS